MHEKHQALYLYIYVGWGGILLALVAQSFRLMLSADDERGKMVVTIGSLCVHTDIE